MSGSAKLHGEISAPPSVRSSPAGVPNEPSPWRCPPQREIWTKAIPHLPGLHRKFLLRMLLSFFGRCIVAVHGLERLSAKNDPFIVAINHSTRLEALLLPVMFALQREGRVVSFIADWNFALIPGIATILRAGDSILLVRKPAKPAILNVFKPLFLRKGTAFEQAAVALGSGRSIGIFPEGTTNRHPTRLLRGFDGAARLSLTTGVPVLPVGIRFPGHPCQTPIRDRTPMELFVGEPLRPSASAPEASREAVREWHARIMMELARLSGKSWDTGSTRRKHHGFE